VLGRGAIFMQAWQNHDTSRSKHPPLSLRFSNDSAYRWSVNVARDVRGVDNRFTHGSQQTIYTSPQGLAKGVWHEFIVRFRPSASGSGIVQVWLNGEQVV